jgi:AAA ATPase domain
MAREAARAGRPSALIDRHSERAALDRLLGAVRAGQSQVLVVRGDPGVGKTVLLDYLAGLAADCRVMRVMGVQPEMELAFAGLHQLCAPLLGWLPRLPPHQRAALRTALGLSAGPPPDRFLVGLAVLSLLAETAGSKPLIGLIDDEQWLDHASAQALGFAGRRLAADPIGLVFAARVPGPELAGLPELVVPGLGADDARALLESVLAGPLDSRVRDLILAETNGNPLALLELPRGLSPAELAGGFGLPGAVPVTGRIEDSFGRQLDALPDQTRRLRAASQMLATMGAGAFAERARRELLAAGVTLPRRAPETRAVRETGRPTPRSSPSCSSAPARWNGTWATCSPSSGSRRAASCGGRSLPSDKRPPVAD